MPRVFSIRKTLGMVELPKVGVIRANSAIPRVFLIGNTFGMTKFSLLVVVIR